MNIIKKKKTKNYGIHLLSAYLVTILFNYYEIKLIKICVNLSLCYWILLNPYEWHKQNMLVKYKVFPQNFATVVGMVMISLWINWVGMSVVRGHFVPARVSQWLKSLMHMPYTFHIIIIVIFLKLMVGTKYFYTNAGTVNFKKM